MTLILIIAFLAYALGDEKAAEARRWSNYEKQK